MAHDDTICAIATPIGEGGIGVIRVSGPHALAIADGLVRLRNGRGLSQAPSHRLQLGDIVGSPPVYPPSSVDSPSRSAKETGPRFLDTALVVVMRAPHSYTGEDVVEFQCHSGPVLLRQACTALLEAGARLADPGEFTRRAFLNGRLDLSQAEGILDTIQARTEQSLRVAQELARGMLSGEIRQLVEILMSVLAHVEAGIDFVEDDMSFVTPSEVMEKLGIVQQTLSRLLDSWEEGRLLRQGAKVVIAGRPNVGKSSLLNALLKSDRAIVTAVPGTTRDVLEESVNIGGVPIRLVDTAGVRDSIDPVEIEGVRRTHQTLGEADLIVVVVDGSVSLTGEDRAILSNTRGKRRILVVNKADRPERLSSKDRLDLQEMQPAVSLLRISATTGLGIETVQGAIIRALPQALEAAEGTLVTRLRHRDALARAQESVMHVRESTDGRLSGEFLAVDLRAAVNALGEIVGSVTTDDLLDRIFSEFCIGK